MVPADRAVHRAGEGAAVHSCKRGVSSKKLLTCIGARLDEWTAPRIGEAARRGRLVNG